MALIGEGGMGQVYQATDTKLNRQVALKILPEAFAADPDRLARFQREAQVLASLNHPGIAAIYGIEERDDTRALVLELVEGPTLADRISKGPIPLDEALPIAKQIAQALEAAHEAGVIHRDLKPANIKVRDDGTVKVLDFGLAKALDTNPEGDPSQSPTLTAAATQMGVIMGTAAYMSPEQARGKAVDKRADIWSFGVVVFEILTGKRAFAGTDVSETLAYVITKDIDWASLPTETPDAVRHFLRRCLVRDPRQRLRDIGEARIGIEEPEGPSVAATADKVDAQQFQTPMQRVVDAFLDRVAADRAAASRVWQRPVTVIGAILIAIVVTGFLTWRLTQPVLPPAIVERFSIALGPGQALRGITGRRLVALSPDGTQLVYQADAQLFLRRLDRLEASPIAATAGVSTSTGGVMEPFISPDGQWIGFWAEGQIRKVGITGGAAVTVCEAGIPYGITWAEDDTILFGQAPEGVLRVSADGGTPEVIVRVEEGERARAPQMLPGGEYVLFTLRPAGVADWDDAQIVTESVLTGERTVLLEGGYDARFLPTRHLVYALDDALLAAPFDVATRQVTRGSVPLIEGVAHQSFIGTSHFAVSRSGSLAYVPDVSVNDYGPGSLRWVDRQGRILSEVGTGNVWGHPRLSPDGLRAAAVLTGDGDRGADSTDVWVLALEGGRDQRLTEDGISFGPLPWTPNGRNVTFASWGAVGREGLFERPADQSSEPVPLVTPSRGVPADWSPDGETLVYQVPSDATAYQNIDLWMLSRGLEPTPFLATEFNERAARLSSDGQWVAYVSDQAGDDRVYVQPFPGGGQVVPVSAGPGTEPVWARDGRRLFYRNGSEMFEVEVTTGPSFTASTPPSTVRRALSYEPRWPRQLRRFDRWRTLSDDEWK